MENDHPFITLHCIHCGTSLQVQLNCKDRTCPTCRAKWFGHHFNALLPHIRTWERIYFMTLTIQNIPDKEISSWHIKKLREYFSRLRQKKGKKGEKPWKDRIEGGFYVVQTTNYGNGWHLHLHILYRGSYIAQAELSKAWREITKKSFVVDIREVQSPKEALRYMLKDFLAEPIIRPEDKATYNSLFYAKRLVQPFGTYYKTKLKAPFPCPQCGGVTWALLDDILGEKRKFVRTYMAYDDDT